DELDLADAAFAQLDVVARVQALAGMGAALPVHADAFPQPAQGRERVEIEVLAVHEGAPQGFDIARLGGEGRLVEELAGDQPGLEPGVAFPFPALDRKSTRLNSSHVKISYAVFCLKKKK